MARRVRKGGSLRGSRASGMKGRISHKALWSKRAMRKGSSRY